MNLGDGELGKHYTILSIACDAPAAQRLMNLGFLPGLTVSVFQVAPLGDPITLDTDFGRISLRRDDARAIEVQPA